MTDCIITKSGRTSGGYGHVYIKGKLIYAHRLAYCEANNLSIEDIKGKVIMHACDNPSCINPAHLSLGTQADNCKDTANKNRSTQGSRNTRSKLTESEVLEIRQLTNKTEQQLAAMYKVNRSIINRIRNRAIWTHI